MQKGRFMKYVVIEREDDGGLKVLFIGDDKPAVQGWLAAYKKMTEAAGLWNVGAIKVVPYDDE